MSITLKALQYFTTAVERGSIARAAEDLHVVPSAVSAAIDQVEQAFALKLVQRYPSREYILYCHFYWWVPSSKFKCI